MFREKTEDAVDMWSTGLGEVWVYRQTRSLATSVISSMARTVAVDNIAAPGLVNIEVLQFQDRARDGPVIHLFIAQNVKFDFGPDFSNLVTLSLNIDPNADHHSYVPAIQPDRDFAGGRLQTNTCVNLNISFSRILEPLLSR